MDATLHPGVLAAGAQKQSRRSGATRVAYRNRLRQAEVGRAILEDRAMRAAAPLSPALVESQATMLRNIHEAQVITYQANSSKLMPHSSQGYLLYLQ